MSYVGCISRAAKLRFFLLLGLAFFGLAGLDRLHAQPQPSAANFKQAYKYSPEFLRQFIYSTSVSPNWIGKTDAFWYEYRTSKGKQWYRVNPREKSKEPLFDRVKLAGQLSEMVKKPLDPLQLPLIGLSLDDEAGKLKFTAEGNRYEYELKAEKLTKPGKAAAPGFPGLPFGKKDDQEKKEDKTKKDDMDKELLDYGKKPSPKTFADGYRNFSPDRKWFAFVMNHNLYVAEAGKEKEALQLTKDGAADYTFAGGLGFGGGQVQKDDAKDKDRKVRANVTWCKDSKAFYVLRNDSRGVKDLFLVNAVANPRPTLSSYRYAMPGDDNIRKSELFVFTTDKKQLTRIDRKWKDEAYGDLHWGKTSNELRFMRRDRLCRNLEVCSYNLPTGESRCLIVEGFENSMVTSQPLKYLDESDEMIWWSERTGWGHFYLCDRGGKLKNPITVGDYRASRIVAVDGKNRLLFFEANSREPGENVYFNHHYCLRLDGTGLTLLDPGNANHQSVLSPSRQWVVDNCSRMDMAPISLLRDARGQKIMDLEQTDMSRLFEVGWKLPETFVVKAADGVTDLYGNMYKPFDFDPKKKYPIIAHVYPGPQSESMPHSFSAGTPISGQQQLAQLGFIVIQVGNRGGTPLRSKAYQSHSYWNMRDYGLADKKSAIEQLAARHAWIDVERVGIYGHSGGGFMTAAAMLVPPYNDFFKVGVASAGNHDNNVYNNAWAERYHGMKEITAKEADAKKAGTVPPPKKTGKGGFPPDDQLQKKGDAKTDKKIEKKDDKKDQKKDETKAKDDKGKDDKKIEKKDDKKDQKKDETKAKEETRWDIKVPTNAELAANLKGRLLLVHGDMDNNVHPANTLRLADALIKANKRFDMLILPGKTHGFADYQPYFNQRMWEFFAEHLLGDHPAGAELYERKK